MTTTTTTTPAPHAHDQDAGHGQGSFLSYLWSTDHKVIGFLYMITGLLMAIIGGYLAYGFRMQLAWPGDWIPGVGFLSSQQYNAYVTTHGTVMIFWFAMPVLLASFGNWLIPLMIGCDDMAFPRINRLSFQVFFISAVILIASFFVDGGAFAGAWTAYPPLSAKATMNLTPTGATMWVIAVAFEFVAFLLGGINFITTAMNARAPGMKMMDIPIVVWTIVVASILFMVSVGPLVAGAAMLVFDQQLGTHFFDPGQGGDPILWQHLFWFFGHPEVYVVLLPAMGIVAEIITCNARKKFFGYKTLLYTVFATGIISFFVWAHHQFVAGIDPRMANVFTITTLIISIPIAEMVFLYIATLVGGQIRLNVPMLWALAFVAEFLLGGVTGIFLGASGSDIYFHDTYFVIAHFHYTFVPIAVIACFAGFTHWIPKMTGKMMNETIGKLHFWTTIVGFNLAFLPLFITGAWGDHRRIYNYEHFPDLTSAAMQDLRIASTVGLLIMIAAQALFVWNLLWTWKKGPPAGDNPWQGTTLEWSTSSPPGHGNFHPMPTVYRGPYEYSVPGAAADFTPQSQPPG